MIKWLGISIPSYCQNDIRITPRRRRRRRSRRRKRRRRWRRRRRRRRRHRRRWRTIIINKHQFIISPYNFH